MWPYN